MFRLFAILMIMLLTPLTVGAESISECITDSPNDSEIVAIQVRSEGNTVQRYEESTLDIMTDLIDEPGYEAVLLGGEVTDKISIWTDTWRREVLVYSYKGEDYLVILGDERLPGVRTEDAWHCSCVLKMDKG